MTEESKPECVALIFIEDKPVYMDMLNFKQWFKREVDKIKQDKEKAK